MKKRMAILSAFLLSAMLIFSGCSSFVSYMEQYSSKSGTSDSSVTESVPAKTDNISSESTVYETEETTISETMQTTSAESEETAPIKSEEVTVPAPVYSDAEEVPVYSDLIVHFIDVGQGDSIFIELPDGETMLIDAGESDQGDKVVTYIYSQGYDSIDYVVATHAHSDHIGGLPDVLGSFNIGNFYMTSAASSTVTYEKMLTAIQNSGADVYDVMAGDIILESGNLLVEVVAPKAIDNDEMNNNSIVIKLTYGDNKFLFTGDAEKSEEDGIWTNIKCDVLKVGHHGSDSSTSENFLKKVEPTYAVISCGLGNSYGHPTDKVLRRLYERNINTYRTDLQGTIVFTSDGSEISVSVSPSEYTPPAQTTTAAVTTPQDTPAQSSGTTYILNTNTKKIHYSYCSSVKTMKESNKSYTEDYDGAIAAGYVPCKRCNP